MDAVGEVNGYPERAAPWREAKDVHEERVSTILCHAAEALHLLSVLLHPVLPERTAEAWGGEGEDRIVLPGALVKA